MKYFIQTVDGHQPVKALKVFEFRGEVFFMHVHHQNRDAIGITHMETGLTAGHVPRYTGYRAVSMKKVERSKDDWRADALYRLGRASVDRFNVALVRAREDMPAV